MSATVIPFPLLWTQRRQMAARQPSSLRPAPLTPAWQDEHMPLVDAAMVMLRADDAEFKRRCRAIADADGFSMLEHITGRLDRLAAQVGDAGRSLAMTAKRMRSAMAAMRAAPA